MGTVRTKARTRVMAISFGRDQLPRLDAVAARKRVSRSALVRAAVEALLGRYEADHGDEQRAAAGDGATAAG